MLHAPPYNYVHTNVDLMGMCPGCVLGANILLTMVMNKLGYMTRKVINTKND